MSQASSWEQVLDYANRANPYPFYAELRRTPVTALPDGTYVVSGYAEIASLLHDPRVSSDITRNPMAAALGVGDDGGGPGMSPTFLSMDPPEHDKLRRIACATSDRLRRRAASPAWNHESRKSPLG
jgi:cytochrome P450